MATRTKATVKAESDFEQFGRILDRIEPMPAILARPILQLRASEADHARLSELLAKNSENQLSADERAELDDRVLAGQWISIMQSLARGSTAQSSTVTATNA